VGEKSTQQTCPCYNCYSCYKSQDRRDGHLLNNDSRSKCSSRGRRAFSRTHFRASFSAHAGNSPCQGHAPATTATPATNHDKGGNARPAASEPPTRPEEPGLSPYTIRELAHWYEEEGNRRRLGSGLDQELLDRDLRRVLAERGVFPEFIEIEFERVMQVVFAVPSDAPWPDKRKE
jgi:hypothetical protein